MINQCLLVGLGQIGMGYDLHLSKDKIYTHARALAFHSEFELVAAVDPEESQRNIFSFHYKKRVFCDLLSVSQADVINVVIIASPTELHGSIIRDVLKHFKPKLILCEKPLAYDLLEARLMVEACENANVDLLVNYIRRADPGVIDIKNRIESGEIAGPIKGCVWYSKGFLNNGSHFFNLLEFWLGAYVKFDILESGRVWNSIDPEPDVQVWFERGKVVFMAAYEEAFSHYTVELVSPSGRLRYEQGGETIIWQAVVADPNIAGYKMLKVVPETISNEMDRYQLCVLDQVANALVNKPHTLSTGRQSLDMLEAMHQIINQR